MNHPDITGTIVVHCQSRMIASPVESAPDIVSIVVQKFGGTSVGDIPKIRRVAEILSQTVAAGHRVVVVVSAMGKSTDALVALAKEVTDQPTGPKTSREYDALLATGEMVTTALLAMVLNEAGHPAVGLNGRQAGVLTEDVHNQARIQQIDTEAIHKHLEQGLIVVVTGFQGCDSLGATTTLGRGGSDTSAVALAAVLEAERCDIFTDVRGVFSTDPRIVANAVKQDHMAYVEMLELARVGANVLHPRAVETARENHMPLYVRSTFDLDDPGTLVSGVNPMEVQRSVAGIACDHNQVRLALAGVPDRPGIAAEVFGRLAERQVSVDMIIQSLASRTDADHPQKTNDIAFTVQRDDLPEAMSALEQLKTELDAREVLIDPDVAKVSIVGVGMIDRPGIAADMFKALSQADVNIRMISTSEIKISCLVDKSKADEAVQVIHAMFFDAADSTPEDMLVNEKIGY